MPLKLMSKPFQNLLKNFSESPFAEQKIIKDQKQHKSPVVSCRLKLILKRVMEVVEVARRRLVVSVISFRTEGGGDEVNARQAKIFGPDLLISLQRFPDSPTIIISRNFILGRTR